MVKKRIATLLSLKIVYELFTCKNGLTIMNLAENIKTDYKNTHNAIDILFENGIIKKEKIGNYNICKLNNENEDIISYLKLHNHIIRINDFRAKHNIEYQIIKESIGHLKDEMNPFFICLVFGSYAKDEEKKGSDIDILFLTSNLESEAIIKKTLGKVNAPYSRRFHLIVQSIESFKKDLMDKDKLSIAIEIDKQPPIIFYGDDIFYRMVA